MDEIEKLIKENVNDPIKAIRELKSGRITTDEQVKKLKDQLDPLKHEVFDKEKRPDKKVQVDEDDSTQTRIELVARVALALQKLIVNRAVSFLFGNPVRLNAEVDNERQQIVFKAIKKLMADVKEKSINRRLAKHLLSCKEVAEHWYPVEKPNNVYGFPSKFKLRCAIYSPMFGDTLYPYFDLTGDMVAFSRTFSIIKDNKTTNYFETFTTNFHFRWMQAEGSYELVEGFPRENITKKIPIIYATQPEVEWQDVQILIERLEKLLSNFADTNDYHASPKIFVKGELQGFTQKGESGGILQGEENSSAEYLSWANAPESVKLEIETLLKMIYTITQTPDISFDAVKGIGNISGVALKLLFMDAHLKVQDHAEVFDEYLPRRLSVVKAFIGLFNTSLKEQAESLLIEPEIVPYMITDETAELKIWQDANGGNPIISQKASFQKAGLTNDPDADFNQYQGEQDSLTARQNSFSIGEPTPA